jgi:hypothetical protein
MDIAAAAAAAAAAKNNKNYMYLQMPPKHCILYLGFVPNRQLLYREKYRIKEL